MPPYMTAGLRFDCSSRLLLQLILLTAVGYNTADGQTFNVSLMKTSCDWGLLKDVDNVIINGVIDMQGLAVDHTMYHLQVHSTSDNKTFTPVCNTGFTSSECKYSIQYGCHCTKAKNGGQTLYLVVKQRATEELHSKYYRLLFNWTDSQQELLNFVSIPHIYGEESSWVMVSNTSYPLSKGFGCTLSEDALSKNEHILFCTKNLNSPILAVNFHEDDVVYYVNQDCAKHYINHTRNSSGLLFTFTYTDNCSRSQTFTCKVGDLTFVGAPTDPVRNSTSLIILGTAMSMLFFVGVVFTLCRDGHEEIDDTRRRTGQSSTGTISGTRISRPVSFKDRQEDDSPYKGRVLKMSDAAKPETLSTSSSI